MCVSYCRVIPTGIDTGIDTIGQLANHRLAIRIAWLLDDHRPVPSMFDISPPISIAVQFKSGAFSSRQSAVSELPNGYGPQHDSQDTRYKNFIHNPMRGKGKRSGVAYRSMASPTYNKNMSIWLRDY